MAWHLSGEKIPSQLHASVLRKRLLRGNDPDHNFHNCPRELQSQTVPSFGRKQGPSSHSHFLQHLNPSVTTPAGSWSSRQEGDKQGQQPCFKKGRRGDAQNPPDSLPPSGQHSHSDTIILLLPKFLPNPVSWKPQYNNLKKAK